MKTVDASGKLTFKGKPLEFHQVTFFPEDGQRPAAGTTDLDGNFTLGTNSPGDGAVSGSHRVSISYVGPPSDDPEFGMNDFSNPPPPQVRIPARYGDPAKSGIVEQVPTAGTSDLKIDLE